jgi:hypothetical protein
MSKSITKNVRYDKFNNFCVAEDGKDVKETPVKGVTTLNACLAGCVREAMNPKRPAHECSGAEWYAGGRDGYKCYHVNQGMGKKRAAKGSPGKRFKDATCYVRG